MVECWIPALAYGIILESHTAISQHIRNQYADGIRHLYVYSQLLLSIATLQAKYVTTDTMEEFWTTWKELVDEQDKEKIEATGK